MYKVLIFQEATLATVLETSVKETFFFSSNFGFSEYQRFVKRVNIIVGEMTL
jgi:hypothetical protein